MRWPFRIIFWSTFAWLLAPLAAALWIMAVAAGIELVGRLEQLAQRLERLWGRR